MPQEWNQRQCNPAATMGEGHRGTLQKSKENLRWKTFVIPHLANLCSYSANFGTWAFLIKSFMKNITKKDWKYFFNNNFYSFKTNLSQTFTHEKKKVSCWMQVTYSSIKLLQNRMKNGHPQTKPQRKLQSWNRKRSPPCSYPGTLQKTELLLLCQPQCYLYSAVGRKKQVDASEQAELSKPLSISTHPALHTAALTQ